MDSPMAEDRDPRLLDFPTRPSRDPAPGVSVCRHRSGRWAVIVVAGEMDLQAVPLVHKLLASAASAASHVVFDLSAVTFMDASGLGVLLDGHRLATRARGCVRLVAPSDQTCRLLVLARCDRVFRAFDSVEEATSAPVPLGPAR